MACLDVAVEGDRFRITIAGSFSRSMLSSEETIQSALNEAGRALTVAALDYLDTDGGPIEIAGTRLHSKGKIAKTYHTPYGDVRVARHVYQGSRGGVTYCPMERDGRLLMGNTTPLFARQVASKFARNDVREVQRDLAENHGRKVTVSLLQRIGGAVAAIAAATEEEDWSYEVPELERPVETIAISLDGTCMLMCESGWREAMTGSLSLYDRQGERLHTIYLGAAPEYGKEIFRQRLTREIERLKQLYPQADFVGLADGAECNWKFLEQHTSVQILDFYHATGYLGAVAKAFHPSDIPKQEQWLDTACHMLKHEQGAAQRLYDKMRELGRKADASAKKHQELAAAITYFAKHKHQMNYRDYRARNLPIGSGVIEAACKVLIKQRLCQAGMRWKEPGAAAVIALRALDLTPSRWQQFWDKINRFGLTTD